MIDRFRDELIGLVPEAEREHASRLVDTIVASTEEKPAEVFIGVDEVENRHMLTESAEMLECSKNIMFHQPYYRVIANLGSAQNGTSLYQALKWWCDWEESRKNEKDESKIRQNDTIASLIEMVITLPMEAFGDSTYLLDLGMAILKEKNKYYKRLEKVASTLGKSSESSRSDSSASSDVRAIYASLAP